MDSIRDIVIRLLVDKGFEDRFDDASKIEQTIYSNDRATSLKYSSEDEERLDIDFEDTGRSMIVVGSSESKDGSISIFQSFESDDVVMLDIVREGIEMEQLENFRVLSVRYNDRPVSNVFEMIKNYEILDYKYVRNLRELMVRVSGIMGVYDLGIKNDVMTAKNEKYKSGISGPTFMFETSSAGRIFVRYDDKILFSVDHMAEKLVKMDHPLARKHGEEVVVKDYNTVLRFFKEFYFVEKEFR